jgi:hypothetical protein
MPGGTMVLSYENGRMPLDFSLGLISSRRETMPGSAGDAIFSSRVRVVDSERGFRQEHVISMNQPVKQGNLAIYQSTFDEAAHGRKVSSFLVSCDPGRTWKHCGSLLIVVGIAVMAFMSAYSFNIRSRASLRSSSLSGREAREEKRSPVALRPAA